MKTLFITLLLSFSAFAAPRTVECKMVEGAYRNQFAVEFTFDDEAQSFDNLELNFKLRPNVRDAQTTEQSLTRSGSIAKIEAGVLAKNPIWVLTSVDKADEFQYINLVVDYPANLNSTIRLQNDFGYSSTCRSL